MKPGAGRALGVFAMLCAGCTIDDGRGFATLRQATLEASFQPGARAFEGSVLTDHGYRFRVDEFVLRAEALELEAGASTPGAVVFDPSDPPPGYGSCHGEHCHADDGRLVSYAEIQAELAGGRAGLSVVASFAIDRSMDLLAPRRVALRHADPSNELPRSQIRQVTLDAAAVELRGTCAGGPSALQEVPFTMAFARSSRFTVPLSLEISRDGPDALSLDVALVVDGSLFDGADWAALVQDGALRVDDADSAAGQALILALSSSEMSVGTTEGEP